MKEERTSIYPKGSAPYESSGLTFGKFLKAARIAQKLSQKEVADKLGISSSYYKDLEEDRRYPPAGELFSKIEEVFCQEDSELENQLAEIAGIIREEVPPDNVEFLRRNSFARHMVDLMRQVDINAIEDNAEGKACNTMQSLLRMIASLKDVKLKLPSGEDLPQEPSFGIFDDNDDGDYEYIDYSDPKWKKWREEQLKKKKDE